MTNYNKRLDKILGIFSGGITAKGSDRGGYPTYFTEPYPIWCEVRKNKAKQALTSLIKELVAEVKPEVKVFDDGINDATYFQQKIVDHYEANLLKALESKSE